jgi:nitroreductase
MDVRDAVTSRKSIRRFLSTPIDLALVQSILTDASRAPSGSNTQPWRVEVVSGASLSRVSNAVLEGLAKSVERKPYYTYFPDPLPAPYKDRLSDFAMRLSALDGIDRRSPDGPRKALAWNYKFFGAPVGMFFHLGRDMQFASWIDIGMFMQNVMVLAKWHGLDTCPQVSWTNYGAILHDVLEIGKDRLIVAGMALGYADPKAAPNQLETPREALGDFARFH